MENVHNSKLPVHVAVIMDGNGRWAKARGLDRLYGHKQGAESVRACCRQAVRDGVKYLSLFAFSEENWSRPEAEVKGLMELMLKSILNERHLFIENGIAFRVIGRRDRIGAELLEAIRALEEDTASFRNMTLTIFFDYSGMWDILQAAGRYAADVLCANSAGGLSREVFGTYLSTAGMPDPDLLIRTSGEKRISNFMLWQCAYTEFYFTDILWPDFREEQWSAALQAFACRDRRYGKVK